MFFTTSLRTLNPEGVKQNFTVRPFLTSCVCIPGRFDPGSAHAGAPSPRLDFQRDVDGTVSHFLNLPNKQHEVTCVWVSVGLNCKMKSAQTCPAETRVFLNPVKSRHGPAVMPIIPYCGMFSLTFSLQLTGSAEGHKHIVTLVHRVTSSLFFLPAAFECGGRRLNTHHVLCRHSSPQ